MSDMMYVPKKLLDDLQHAIDELNYFLANHQHPEDDDDDLPLGDGRPPELDEPQAVGEDFAARLTRRLAEEFPDSMPPSQTQLAELEGLVGDADWEQAVEDMVTVLARKIVPKMDAGWRLHVVAILKSLRAYGYASLKQEAAVVRKTPMTAAQAETERRRENDKLAANPPPPPIPNPDLKARLAAAKQRVLSKGL